MKHAILLILSVLLGSLGTFILVADILHGGQLHVVSASVGTGMLVAALVLAIPLEVKKGIEVLGPLLPLVRK